MSNFFVPQNIARLLSMFSQSTSVADCCPTQFVQSSVKAENMKTDSLLAHSMLDLNVL